MAGAGEPPRVQLQRGAARTTPGRIPRTVRLRARPCQRRPRSHQQDEKEGARKYTLAAAHSAPTPAPGAAAPGRRDEAAEAGRRNRRPRAGDGAGLPRCAPRGWRLPRPGPAAPAPPNPGTDQACESPAPRAAPARALQPPRPHAAPQAPGSGGPAASSRPGPAPLLPAARRPGARLGGSPRELASSSLRPPTYLPRMGVGGCRGPVLLPLLGGRAGGPGGDSAGRPRLGLSAAGVGAHRTGPVGAAARAARSLRAERRPREGLEESAARTATAALIPGAGRARGAGEGGREQPGGARGGETERAHARAHSRSPAPPPPSSAVLRSPSLGPSLTPARSPAAARPAPAKLAIGTSGASALSPSPGSARPCADCARRRGDRPRLAGAGWAPPPLYPGKRTMGALSPQPSRRGPISRLI